VLAVRVDPAVSTVRLSLPAEIFRENDIRGVVGRALNRSAGEAIARAFGTFLRRAGVGRVVVGCDNRPTSEGLYRAAISGLRATGCDVAAIGLAVTPMVYFALVHLRLSGGVMVTASHNPPEFNGFKLAYGPGTLFGPQIQELRAIAAEGAFAEGAGTLETQSVQPAYAAMLADKIRLGPRRLRVAVDCGNGAAGPFVPEILRTWGCEVLPLYCDLDPAFPHHYPDPVDPKNLTDLIGLVKSAGADLGIGIDGDGDRLGVVDEHGEIVWSDVVMALFWQEILPSHRGTVAPVEVKCSQALLDQIRRLGGRPELTPTGHSLIKARMRQVGAPFAGEMSGHFFFADEYYGYDDAIYAAGRLLRMLSRTDVPLSSLAAKVARYHATPEMRVACPEDRKRQIVAALADEFRKRHDVVDVDGVRVIFPDGWGLVRASNTQAVLVVRAEGATPDALDRAKDTLEKSLRRFPEVAPIDW
jgi:phosphomannomutase/phosphoglucomutase